MNNKLNPRAKIGDVVIVKKYFRFNGDPREDGGELRVDSMFRFEEDGGCYHSYNKYDDEYDYFYDKDILKNLTTNKSYE